MTYGVHIDDDSERRVHSIRSMTDLDIRTIAVALHVASNVLLTRFPDARRAEEMAAAFKRYVDENVIKQEVDRDNTASTRG